MAQIKVTAGEGRLVPIDRSIATAPGAQQLYLKPGDELEVDNGHSSIQRQLRSGDLVELKQGSLVFSSTKEAVLEADGPAAKFEEQPFDGSKLRAATPKKER